MRVAGDPEAKRPLLPASGRGRALLSAWFVVHLVLVVNYVWLDEDAKRLLRPISKPYVEWLQLTQKWNMFRNPARSDVFLEAERVRQGPVGEEVEPLDISMAPPDGAFLRFRYDRMVKVHNILAYEDDGGGRYAEHYARWLCGEAHAQGGDEIRLYRKRVKHPTMEVRRADPYGERETTREAFLTVECP